MVKASSVKRLPSGRLKYNGETFPGFNKVQRTPGDTKKFKVLAKKGPDVRKITFGDSNMTIKKSNPKTKPAIVRVLAAFLARMTSFQRIIGRVRCGIVSMMYMKKTSMTPGSRSTMANQPTPPKKKKPKKKKKTYASSGVTTGRYSSNG